MANLARASSCFEFDQLVRGLDVELTRFLETAGMLRVPIFANYFESEPDTPEAFAEALELARHAGAGDQVRAWALTLEELHKAAKAKSPSIAKQLAAVDGL